MEKIKEDNIKFLFNMIRPILYGIAIFSGLMIMLAAFVVLLDWVSKYVP